MQVAADQHLPAACIAGGVDFRLVKEANVMTGDQNAAAVLPHPRAGSVQSTAQIHRAALRVAQQPDRAVVVLDGLRLDHAGIVHNARQEAPRRLCGHEHLTTVSPDHTPVLNQRVHLTLADGYIEQSVTGHVKGDGVACGERHRTEFGRDHAFIADVRAQQGDIAAAIDGDRPLIEDRAITRTGKLISARHGVAVGDVEGRSYQSAHVHLRPLAEQDAARIQQKHFAVGQQIAKNARRI